MDQYKCGYCGFLLNSQCQDLLQHQCLKERYVEIMHDLVEDHKKVLTIVPKNLGSNDQGVSFDEETLIKFVQERPALYNLGLPLLERSTRKKQELWTQISNIFGGQVSVEDLQKKWKYLRDSYVRAKKKLNQYKPSGSAAQAPPDPGFKFFEAMKFVDDGASQQRTVCSFTSETNETQEVQPGCSSGASSSSTSLISPQAATPSVKRKRADEKTRIDVQKEIADIMSRPVEKPIDGVDGFLIRLGESLRRLPYRERAKLEIKMMTMVYEAELKNDNK